MDLNELKAYAVELEGSPHISWPSAFERLQKAIDELPDYDGMLKDAYSTINSVGEGMRAKSDLERRLGIKF